MYIVTTSQMQAAEKAADASGLPYAQMMENAGRAVAQAIDAHFDVMGVQVLVLVGPGNNGGDGLVAAHIIARPHREVEPVLNESGGNRPARS